VQDATAIVADDEEAVSAEFNSSTNSSARFEA
jgi:hypothetical protein